jgi:tetratricopeptide (TPR) repeat protein
MGLADQAYRTIPGLAYDPYAMVLIFLAVTLAYLGYVDQARSRINQALSEGRRLGRAHTLVHGLNLANWIDWLTRAPEMHLKEFLSLSAEHGFPHYLSWAEAFRGRSLVVSKQAQEGFALLTEGLAELRAAGAVVNTPMLLTWLAEAHGRLEQPAEALSCLAEAARIVETTDERVSEAELLHRVRGDLSNAAGDRSAAEQHYHEAIAVAERQSAKLLQLRASISLARLWRDQGKRSEGRDLLHSIYNCFPKVLMGLT